MTDHARIVELYTSLEQACERVGHTPKDGGVSEAVALALGVPVEDVKAAMVLEITMQGAGR